MGPTSRERVDERKENDFLPLQLQLEFITGAVKPHLPAGI
jgi:hypothetical protein